MAMIIGHRGSSDVYPENTMLAYNKAIEEGAQGIETDIWKSSDGQYVLIHDATVDRTTAATGAVDSFTFNQLINMDAGAWKSEEFNNRNDTKIPSLDNFLTTYKDSGVLLLLQVKLGVTDSKAIINIVKNKNMLDQCIIFTAYTNLNELAVYEPNVMLMNDGTDHNPNTLITQAVNENWYAVSTGITYWTQEAVTLAKNSGLKTQVSYISSNYAYYTNLFYNMGVDYILGDNVLKMINSPSSPKNVYHKSNGEWIRCDTYKKGDGVWNKYTVET